ncbi:hypothetical protein HID58_023246 [Brassica napus]|uniref:Uncharacterized protein n=1 Tax=Brassica napus TaxID=3708 RepID=A0ABQ8D373_BRANA|nr:hypothetical protein HID58_023246 [Brassica napus]
MINKISLELCGRRQYSSSSFCRSFRSTTFLSHMSEVSGVWYLHRRQMHKCKLILIDCVVMDMLTVYQSNRVVSALSQIILEAMYHPSYGDCENDY